jgi:outer membrane biosynthesis protein TonB
MADKVKILMPKGNGKKRLVETFEGSSAHQLALQGLKGYSMPDAADVEKASKAEKKTVTAAVGKLPVEEIEVKDIGDLKIEDLDAKEEPQPTEQAPKEEVVEQAKPTKKKSGPKPKTA